MSADGFFEPEKEAGAKGIVPWSHYAMGNRQPFFMGGLWNADARPKTSETVTTYTVITTSANDVFRINDRMPVILEDGDSATWLSPSEVPAHLLKPYPAERMAGWRVVDEARNSRIPDHSGMIEPLVQQGFV